LGTPEKLVEIEAVAHIGGKSPETLGDRLS